MDPNNQTRPPVGTGFLGRGHHRLRFEELGETFFGRVILAKCSDPKSPDSVEVRLSLEDLFARYTRSELEKRLDGVTFEVSPKITELVADAVGLLTGIDVEPHAESVSAFTYYNRHIESRLRWLVTGDPQDNKRPCLDSCQVDSTGTLHVFTVAFTPRRLVDTLAEHIRIDLELRAKLMRVLLTSKAAVSNPGPRRDYRKQAELLIAQRESRQRATGEREMVILSNQIPFRWLIQEWPPSAGRSFTTPALGTTEVKDKVLLPLFLETNGLMDVITVGLESDPLNPFDVVVRYFVARPARANVFGAWHQGLNPQLRARLNEAELSVFDRLQAALSENLVFGGRPQLERSYADLAQWVLRKVSYCLEEPSFLREPATAWLSANAGRRRVEMEDEFFLPEIYERLRTDFGSRVVKKPKRFGGEIDILLDDVIPVELKVRRGKKRPLADRELDETFRPGSQAASYAAVSRLGVRLVLDLPKDEFAVTNLESCAKVTVRRFPGSEEFPTCIVVFIFHCHHARPSSAK